MKTIINTYKVHSDACLVFLSVSFFGINTTEEVTFAFGGSNLLRTSKYDKHMIPLFCVIIASFIK